MLDQTQLDRLIRIMPRLRAVSNSEIVREIQQHAFFARISAGKDLFAPGDDVSAIALVMSGSIRVYKASESGREITLYRFSAGESCILSANAILNNEMFSALATVEEDAEAVMIPANVFRRWVSQYPFWREFVFSLLAQRLSVMMEIVDEVAFGRLDRRLIDFLLERYQPNQPITITHQQIADELGSSREVISRLLGGFASKQYIRLGRGTIEILDPRELANASDS